MSAATQPFTPHELGELLSRARAKNASLRIGGILIHHDGSFIQVLEGEEAAVEQLFRQIAIDPRHRRVMALARAAVDRAAFAGWSMGFADSRHAGLASHPGFVDFSAGKIQVRELETLKNHVFYLIEAFSGGRLHQFVSA